MNILPRFPFRSMAAAAAFAMLAGYVPGVGAQGTATEATAKPPRIGLALSGGGARGIAHVGVLKALEEMRVPIHCVTGTSMGAIVGGLSQPDPRPRKWKRECSRRTGTPSSGTSRPERRFPSAASSTTTRRSSPRSSA